MAKRKRLTLPESIAIGEGPEEMTMFPTYPNGVAPTRTRQAPIADVAGDAAMMAALEDVTQTLTQARSRGRLVLDLPLEAISETYLTRDRVGADAGEMAALCDSLRQRGQQNPIEVTDLGGGRFGLISGWRRLTALRQLKAEDADKFGTVQALLRIPADSSDAYLAMVEENEIRVGLSYFERARIAAKTVEHGVFPTEKAALLTLYHAASRPKRSKIRSFLTVVHALDGHLRFPAALGERLGLSLAKAIEADAGLTDDLRKALQAARPETAEAEQALLQKVLRGPAKTGSNPPLETEITPAGITVKAHADGRLTLTGAGVTPALRPALLAWLRDWNGT